MKENNTHDKCLCLTLSKRIFIIFTSLDSANILFSFEREKGVLKYEIIGRNIIRDISY